MNYTLPYEYEIQEHPVYFLLILIELLNFISRQSSHYQIKYSLFKKYTDTCNLVKMHIIVGGKNVTRKKTVNLLPN